MNTPDPRAGLRDLTGDYTHMHNRCRQREAALAGLLREARTDNAREGR